MWLRTHCESSWRHFGPARDRWLSDSFRYCIDGHPLRGTLYPPRYAFSGRRSAGIDSTGTCTGWNWRRHLHLQHVMLHDDRKSSENFMRRQRRYADLEARYLWSQRWVTLNWRKRLRRLLFIAPGPRPPLHCLERALSWMACLGSSSVGTRSG